MSKSLQEISESTSPLHDEELDAIKHQIVLWGETYGPKIWQYLFDIAFFRLVKYQGFEYANSLLTETRKALKRSMGSHVLGWIYRCKRQAKKGELEAKAERPQQPQVEAA